MGSSVLVLLAIPILGFLAFVFGKNARKGIRNGAVYVERTRYFRAEDPIYFWLGVGFSILFAGASLVGVLVAIWALISLT